MVYAQNTDVSSLRSRNHIERTLQRHGADGFWYVYEGNVVAVMFTIVERRVRFTLQMPDPAEFRYTNQTPPRERSQKAQVDVYEQAHCQKWRALLLVIKAKLEAVESGISTVEAEFLANIVLPVNNTAGDWIIPQIGEAYRTGEMPPMLPA